MSDEEMMKTFNMGVGFVLIVPARDASRMLSGLRRLRQPAWVVGEVIPGEGEIVYV